MTELSVEDVAELRKQGDFRAYLLQAAGRAAAVPAAAPAAPGYHLAHVGGWPIGTTATGPTPTHGRCTCPLCEQAAVVALPRPHDHAEGEAA